MLYHSDNVEASGFVQHLKLPHYVDFQANLELLRRMRGERLAPAAAERLDGRGRHAMNPQATQHTATVERDPHYNFAYLDESTKRMLRRALLKAVAVPGYQVPFGSREMPLPYGWGTGGIQVTAAIIGPDDVLKVIDQGSDDTTNAINIRRFFGRVTGVATTEATPAATIVQTRHRIPETPLRARSWCSRCRFPSRCAGWSQRDRDPHHARAGRIWRHASSCTRTSRSMAISPPPMTIRSW